MHKQWDEDQGPRPKAQSMYTGANTLLPTNILNWTIRRNISDGFATANNNNNHRFKYYFMPNITMRVFVLFFLPKCCAKFIHKCLKFKWINWTPLYGIKSMHTHMFSSFCHFDCEIKTHDSALNYRNCNLCELSGGMLGQVALFSIHIGYCVLTIEFK